MSFIAKAQAAIQAAQDAPASVSFPIMVGSLALSFLQPIAVVVTIVWGVCQIHGFVEKRWGRDFLWLNRILRKGK